MSTGQDAAVKSRSQIQPELPENTVIGDFCEAPDWLRYTAGTAGGFENEYVQAGRGERQAKQPTQVVLIDPLPHLRVRGYRHDYLGGSDHATNCAGQAPLRPSRMFRQAGALPVRLPRQMRVSQ